MDLTMIDLSDVPAARAGDRVTLIGRDGAEQVLAEELAERSGTILLRDAHGHRRARSPYLLVRRRVLSGLASVRSIALEAGPWLGG